MISWWVNTVYSLAHRYWYITQMICCPTHINPEDEGSMFLQNIGIHLLNIQCQNLEDHSMITEVLYKKRHDNLYSSIIINEII
jgi:hypothetical protein